MEFVDQQGKPDQSRGSTNSLSQTQLDRTETDLHVELWVRQNIPPQIRNTGPDIHAEVQHLQENGTITSSALRQWGSFDISGEKPKAEEVITYQETIAEFVDWANTHGYSLRPGFYTREPNPMIGDDDVSIVIPPLLCLAVYKNDTLVAVFPHAGDEHVYTVTNGLQQLKSRNIEEEPGSK